MSRERRNARQGVWCVSIPCRVSRLLRLPVMITPKAFTSIGRVSIPCRVSRLLRLCNFQIGNKSRFSSCVSIPCRVSRLLRHEHQDRLGRPGSQRLNSLSGFSAVTPLEDEGSMNEFVAIVRSQFPVGFLGCYAAGSSSDGFPYPPTRVSIPCRVSRLLRHLALDMLNPAGNVVIVSIPCRVSRLLRLGKWARSFLIGRYPRLNSLSGFSAVTPTNLLQL